VTSTGAGSGQPGPGAGRIFVYLPLADEQSTGMQRFGSEMIRALKRAGLEFEVVIGQIEGDPAWLRTIPHRVVLRGGFWRRLPRAFHPVLRLLWLQFVLPLSRGGGGTVLALAHELAPLPLLRQIAVAHDVTQLRSYAQRDGLAERVRQRLWVRGMQRSARVIAISNATCRDLIACAGLEESAISVIGEGFDPAIFRPAPGSAQPARPYLLYAGTLAPNKNVPFLLRVFARVRERHDVDLVLVGKQDPQEVARLMSGVPEAARASVRFRGFVSDEQLAGLMQNCAAFVFPSLNEGFGLAVVEAMACGAPLISSEAGSLREVVGPGGLLLDPNDEAAWVEAIDKTLSDEEYRGALSERGLSRSRIYSWDTAAASYRDLVTGGAGSSAGAQVG